VCVRLKDTVTLRVIGARSRRGQRTLRHGGDIDIQTALEGKSVITLIQLGNL
jgi:hypothetical protein